MHALARQRVQIDRQGTDQGLPLTGAHLGNSAHMQDHAADQLLIVVTQANDASRRLSYDRERLGQNRIERLSIADTLAEFVGHRAKRGIIQRLETRFECVDLNHRLVQRAQYALVATTKNTRQDTLKHRSGISG